MQDKQITNKFFYSGSDKVSILAKSCWLQDIIVLRIFCIDMIIFFWWKERPLTYSYQYKLFVNSSAEESLLEYKRDC